MEGSVDSARPNSDSEREHLASDEEKPATTQPGSCQVSDMLHTTWNTTAEYKEASIVKTNLISGNR